MMNKEVEILNDLYSKDKQELKLALEKKCNWINGKFYIEGNLEKVIKDDKLEHYPFIEALYENNLLFSKVSFPNEYFKNDEILYIKHESIDLRELKLDDEITFNETNFAIEVDFTKLELSNYYALFPNFYHLIEYKDLDIDLKKTNFAEIIKCLIIGKSLQNKIILDKNSLVNDTLYAPVFTKIYYKKEIDQKLLESLNEIGMKLNIEVKVYEGNNLR